MDKPMCPLAALEAAASILGGQSALARLCRRSQPTVWKWLHTARQLPAEHVLAVEAATGVPRYLLRPDLYPVDLPASPARWFGVAAQARGVSDQTTALLSRSAAA